MERRGFLTGGLALGCSAAASPLLTPLAFADAPMDNRLIVIILRGAMDGIDVLRPVGDPDYAALRPDVDAGDGLPLDLFWALHPALASLLPLWGAGEFGAVHAVSTPYRDARSHFDGQDVLEAGGVTQDGKINDGWLNRLMQTRLGGRAAQAYAIGREPMAILSGAAPVSRWSPEADLRLSPQAQRLLALVQHDDPLFRDASEAAIALAGQMRIEAQDDAMMAEAMTDDPMMSEVRGDAAHVQIAQFAAARLRGPARIASFSINGWDTHQNQKAAIARALAALGDTILTLRAGLGPVWGQTAVLCMTEFGRTARQNGTRGTDHGTGGALLYAGGAMRGGQIAGRWPGLAEADLYDRRDLMPTRDVRAIAAWVMRGLVGVDRDTLARVVFPGLDLGDDPGLLL